MEEGHPRGSARHINSHLPQCAHFILRPAHSWVSIIQGGFSCAWSAGNLLDRGAGSSCFINNTASAACRLWSRASPDYTPTTSFLSDAAQAATHLTHASFERVQELPLPRLCQ